MDPTRPIPRRARTGPVALASLLVAFAGAVPAGASGAGNGAAGPAPRVVELFTSHGCSSCPPADALFARLVEADPGLVALEYHVDYWDALVHGADGSFADPFSSPAHTDRQRAYAAVGLEGRPGVYTPQLVVDGRRALVGSDARGLGRALSGAPPARAVRVEAAPSRDGARVTARVDVVDAAGLDAGAVDVVLVRYRDETRTEITGGENRHRTAVNHRVVRAVERLGAPGAGAGATFEFAAPGEGEGCAVLVQDRSLRALHGAALCPD